ncbi:KBTB8-like protein [Mya arenaria]|uniref:KBTB8-like protein n=1 Tax=Mya arenaria TaxID=6604 RepID=A0ABY7F7N0_MYAAR|nr:KBTB8-like protein [Mya arenaria]WAR18358.1 KBTB8-like protein [Mya arenaria]
MAQESEEDSVLDLSKLGIIKSYVNYRNDTHESSLLKEMKKLYDDDLLKDITLCVGNLEFSCHKNVLAAVSPYFRLMFTLDLAEKKQDRIEIFEVDSRSMKDILEYAYTGKIKITISNAQNLLSAASLFQILPVVRACANFMENHLAVHNCVGIHYFAEVHNCISLKVKAREFIEKNFIEVCKTEEFYSLTLIKLSEFILSDELNVDKEETVLEAMIAWTEHDYASRKDEFCELLPLVRFGLMISKTIRERLSKHRLVRSCKRCQLFLKHCKNFEESPAEYEGEFDFSLNLRAGMFRPESCLLIVGGVEQTGIRPCINCYNPVTQEGFYIEEFPESRKNGSYDCEDIACVVTENNQIFAGGGNYIHHHLFDDSEDDSFEELEYKEYVVQKDFYQFDMDHNEWLPRSPMLFPKSNFTLASLNGKIYCFGGLTENKHPTEIIEVYDVERNRWNYQGMLPTTLVDLSSVVYSPETEEWTSLAGMLTPRFNFGACLVGNEIYVAGGQIYSHDSYTINREVLRTVEIYNLEANQWRLGPELPIDLFNVCLSVINGALYASGIPEFKDEGPNNWYNVVCRLDFGKNEWEIIEDSLCNVRNFTCVVGKIHTRKFLKV